MESEADSGMAGPAMLADWKLKKLADRKFLVLRHRPHGRDAHATGNGVFGPKTSGAATN
jgi:hypothetical protein